MILIVDMRIIGIMFLLQAALVNAFFVQKSFLGHWQHQFELLSFSKDVEDALSTLEVYNRDCKICIWASPVVAILEFKWNSDPDLHHRSNEDEKRER